MCLVLGSGPGRQTAGLCYNSYGHAFAVFGLTHAYRVTGEERFLSAPVATWENLDILKQIKHSGGDRSGAKRLQDPIVNFCERQCDMLSGMVMSDSGLCT
jgi:hypothetical protein